MTTIKEGSGRDWPRNVGNSVRNYPKIKRNIARAIELCQTNGERYEKDGMHDLALACYVNRDKFQVVLAKLRGN